MDKPYQISIGDIAGLFYEETFATFEELVESVRACAEKYPGKHICCANTDRNDYDCDGLTDDEHETLDEAEADGSRRCAPAFDINVIDGTTGTFIRRATQAEVMIWREANNFVRDTACKPVRIADGIIDTWYGQGLKHPCLAAQ
jgi:hypothetical protein